MQRLNFAQDDSRYRRAWTRMEIDGEIQIRSKALTQHFHMLHRARDLGARFHPLQKVGKLELESRYARRFGFVAQFLRLGERPCRGVVIAPNALRIDGAPE